MLTGAVLLISRHRGHLSHVAVLTGASCSVSDRHCWLRLCSPLLLGQAAAPPSWPRLHTPAMMMLPQAACCGRGCAVIACTSSYRYASRTSAGRVVQVQNRSENIVSSPNSCDEHDSKHGDPCRDGGTHERRALEGTGHTPLLRELGRRLWL